MMHDAYIEFLEMLMNNTKMLKKLIRLDVNKK